MDPALIATAGAGALDLANIVQNIGLWQGVLIYAAWHLIPALKTGGGRILAIIANMVVALDKLAENGIDLRVTAKLVDGDGECLVPHHWAGASGREASMLHLPRTEAAK